MKKPSFKMNPSIFREYDIRGIAGKDFDTEFAYYLGRAYAEYLWTSTSLQKKDFTVSVGRDCRLTSDDIAQSLISGLRTGGLNVINVGICPSPLTYFSIFHLNLDGGIMVTGSHNPADYNGFKIGIGHGTLFGEEIQKLKKIIENNNYSPHSEGQLSSFEVIPAYIEYVVKNTPPLKNKKIVIDSGNGTASTVAPELFKKLGAEVIPLFCELDGTFPNHHPDPTVHENLTEICKVIKEKKADFGVAFDGDADRIGLIDETGRIVFGDELMVILSRQVLKENPGATIISEVKSSHRLYDDIAKNGGHPIMWKTGHSLIKSKMKETGALLAGEMSGHIFFKDRYFGYDDAIYAAVRVYEIASQQSAPVSHWIKDLDPVIATPEIRIDCDEHLKFKLVEKTKELLKKEHNNINDIDGVRIDFPGKGWGLIRASNTQPVLVLRFEALNEPMLKDLREIMQSKLILAAKDINHPELVF